MRIIRHHLVATVLCLVSTILSADEVWLTTDGKVKRDPVFFKPDGSELLFAQLDKPNQLRLMKLDLRDRSVTPLHPDETRSEFEPAVSLDGRWLAFVQNRGNLTLALVIQDLRDNKQSEVPPGGGFSGMHSPAISPDGTTVLFSYPEGNRQQIFAVTTQATNRRTLVDSVGINNWPSFSPDGKQVVFSSTRDDDYDLFVMNADGTNVRSLVKSPRQDIRPRWSPDGRRIAFTSNRDGNYELYVINADGAGLVRITNHPEQDDYACWHPDSRSLIAVCERDGHHDLYRLTLPDTKPSGGDAATK
ncbi:MAG TPA: LpqB family beta-propeller domain-containing protein [Planctomycetaceae bacterium]|nr:LpqB family beta-propeller domain-containing protein [Planctomycetaceae bacterium]